VTTMPLARGPALALSAEKKAGAMFCGTLAAKGASARQRLPHGARGPRWRQAAARPRVTASNLHCPSKADVKIMPR